MPRISASGWGYAYCIGSCAEHQISGLCRDSRAVQRLRERVFNLLSHDELLRSVWFGFSSEQRLSGSAATGGTQMYVVYEEAMWIVVVAV